MKHFLLALLTIYASLGVLASEPIAKHVVFIGLDGWGAYSMPKADMPTTKSLMEKGCYTLQKRTVSPSSSAPNWASMFMAAGPELHGYTTWGARTPELPSRVITKHNIFPTIFQIYRDKYPDSETGAIYEWEGIKYLVDTLSLSYHTHHPYDAEHPDVMCTAAEEYIKRAHPDLVAIFFDNPDHVGHAIGHDTPEYYATLTELDGYITRIVKAIDDAGMTDDTIFIITSDHGGIDKGHGGITMAEMETPFIISGKGVRKGGEFSESMMQYDVASTIAHIFHLEQPQVW
ncbi:MAG: alkaline phosphatase, partial [Muribaculaceae bacterium]|nr:alkaline phosphatase [Muribaculaceae bacterium]